VPLYKERVASQEKESNKRREEMRRREERESGYWREIPSSSS
jgi:hypothetical protein